MLASLWPPDDWGKGSCAPIWAPATGWHLVGTHRTVQFSESSDILSVLDFTATRLYHWPLKVTYPSNLGILHWHWVTLHCHSLIWYRMTQSTSTPKTSLEQGVWCCLSKWGCYRITKHHMYQCLFIHNRQQRRFQENDRLISGRHWHAFQSCLIIFRSAQCCDNAFSSVQECSDNASWKNYRFPATSNKTRYSKYPAFEFICRGER